MGSGSLDRPELKKCLDRLEQGDTLVVWRLDRLGRSIRDLLLIVDRLDKSGINFISQEEFDTSTAAGRLVFHFFAALTQFDRELIRERTMAGLSSARARGRMGGRKKLLQSNWSVTATAAASVTPLVATNAPSSFITGYPASRS